MDAKVGLGRLESQIENLTAQMNDVLTMLWAPETKPGAHQKLCELLQRLHDERARLKALLIEARERGIETIGWADLSASKLASN